MHGKLSVIPLIDIIVVAISGLSVKQKSDNPILENLKREILFYCLQ